MCDGRIVTLALLGVGPLQPGAGGGGQVAAEGAQLAGVEKSLAYGLSRGLAQQLPR